MIEWTDELHEAIDGLDRMDCYEAGHRAGLDAAAQIVQMAREGEHDTDFRSILYSIRALKGTPHDH